MHFLLRFLVIAACILQSVWFACMFMNSGQEKPRVHLRAFASQNQRSTNRSIFLASYWIYIDTRERPVFTTGTTPNGTKSSTIMRFLKIATLKNVPHIQGSVKNKARAQNPATRMTQEHSQGNPKCPTHDPQIREQRYKYQLQGRHSRALEALPRVGLCLWVCPLDVLPRTNLGLDVWPQLSASKVCSVG
jgi:hypothetical protein